MERDEVEAAVRAAFAGVRLGAGLSLRQTAAADAHGAELTRAEFERLPASEVTDDWARVPEADMRRAALGYLDPEGLRYYLPALMLWLLDHYDDEFDEERLLDGDFDLAAIGTLSWIVPGKEARARSYAVLDTFSEAQREAIAAYVEALPRLVSLDRDDAVRVERSIRDYWGRYLPEPS